MHEGGEGNGLLDTQSRPEASPNFLPPIKTKYFDVELMRNSDTSSHARSSPDAQERHKQGGSKKGANLETKETTNDIEEKQEQDETKNEPEHVKQLRSVLEADTEFGWTIRLTIWQSRECIELLKKGTSEESERLMMRYIRWTYEGHDAIARSLAEFLRRHPDALQRLNTPETTFHEKLQILLDSHGLDWNIEEHERIAIQMACIELTAPGMQRGTRTQIARFATGWNVSPDSIAKGLFEDWRIRPEAILILKNGRKAWEEETQRIFQERKKKTWHQHCNVT